VGPNPTDRGKRGTKRHPAVDRQGLPLTAGLTGAERPDATVCAAVVASIPPVRGPRGRPRQRPDKVHADKGYDARHCRRRWVVEHTFRFLKQTLGWHTLRVRHPEQADRWTWLVLVAYTQLRLARALVADRRLPWERPESPGRLIPNRVRRAVPALLLALGSPARVPQPCGRSPGRPQGRRSGPALRYPAIKKAA